MAPINLPLLAAVFSGALLVTVLISVFTSLGVVSKDPALILKGE